MSGTMNVDLSDSFFRKSSKYYYQFPPNSTHSSNEYQDQTISSLQNSISPVIMNFRLSNPNLQPLSDIQKKEIDHWRRKSVDHVYNSVPSTSEHMARHSLGSIQEIKNTMPINRLSTTPSLLSTSTQKFWKYHVLKVGENFLYLTTNPDSKHLYCRNAPGVHVEIRKNYTKYHQANRGFQLVFKDQINDNLFITVTRKVTDKSDEIYIESLGMFQVEKGNIIEYPEPTGQKSVARSVPIKELQSMHYQEINVKPIRYEIMKDGTYHVGSIPQYKPGTSKLKNKRFVFCTSPTNKMMSLFRPHDPRIKKKILKKMNRSTRPASMYSFLENSETKMNEFEQFYTAGDGLRPENPTDDSPNEQKLGWLTIYDEPILQKPGMWELFVGCSLAVGYAMIIDEKLNIELNARK